MLNERIVGAIPKRRTAGMKYLESSTEEVRNNGDLDKTVKRAGLRGTLLPGEDAGS